MEKAKPITHHLLAARERPNSWVAVRFKRHKSWIELNWNDYYLSAEAVGAGLAALGVNRGDRVAILSNTRFEWAALDFGILGLGAVTVPVYQSHRPEELEAVLNHAEPKVLVLEDQTQLRKWEQISKRCRSVERIVCIETPSDVSASTLAWDDLINLGLERLRAEPDFFADTSMAVRMDDLATIVYTSGTSGEPKGAMFSHQQISSEVEDLVRAFPISPADSTLSFLPYAHVLGRVELWLHTYLGFTLNFAESIDKLRGNLRETKPTVLIGVPRVFEKIYSGLMTQVQSQPWRRGLFNLLNEAQTWPARLAADKLIYSQIRQGLGGNLRFVVSGGAPLEQKLAAFFHRAGLLLLEGYGLTETTAAISVNTPDRFEFGSVGRPLADVEIRLADDGEILVKSKKVMTGYYKDEESTAKALRDGYFYTGDIGEWSERGFLRITDRKKDLIKTSGGKYVAPQKLEGLLKLNPLISHALIHGDSRKYVVALVTLNEAFAKTLAREKGLVYRDFKALTQLPEIREAVKGAIAQVNGQLASFETIKNFAILPQDFSVDRGELTPSLKVKRRVCDERYGDFLEDLYR